MGAPPDLGSLTAAVAAGDGVEAVRLYGEILNAVHDRDHYKWELDSTEAELPAHAPPEEIEQHAMLLEHRQREFDRLQDALKGVDERDLFDTGRAHGTQVEHAARREIDRGDPERLALLARALDAYYWCPDGLRQLREELAAGLERADAVSVFATLSPVGPSRSAEREADMDFDR